MTLYLFYLGLMAVTVLLNAVVLTSVRRLWPAWVLSIALAALMALFLWRVSEPKKIFSDLNKAYLAAGDAALRDVARFNELYRRVDFVNLPIVALPFVPFAAIPRRAVAEWLYTGLGAIAVVAIYCYLVQLAALTGWKQLALFGAMAANGPLFNSLREGNTTHFILLLLIAALICLKSGRDRWVGAILAVAAVVKLPLFLLAAFYALKRRWGIVVGFAVTLGVILGVSLLVYGWDLNWLWYKKCIKPYLGRPMGAFNVQSVDGFLARLLLPGYLMNWNPLRVGWEYKALRWTMLAPLLAASFWVCLKSRISDRRDNDIAEFCTILCLAILISPVTWTHYYLIMLLPLALLFGGALPLPEGVLWRRLLPFAMALMSLPVIVLELHGSLLAELYARVFLSHYFYGGLLLLAVLLASRRRQGAMAPAMTKDALSRA